MIRQQFPSKNCLKNGLKIRFFYWFLVQKLRNIRYFTIVQVFSRFWNSFWKENFVGSFIFSNISDENDTKKRAKNEAKIAVFERNFARDRIFRYHLSKKVSKSGRELGGGFSKARYCTYIDQLTNNIMQYHLYWDLIQISTSTEWDCNNKTCM